VGCGVHRGPGAAAPGPTRRHRRDDRARCHLLSSVLPWRSSGGAPTWNGDRHADRTSATVDALLATGPDPEPLVWGGDWNHALSGREYTGNIAGRASVLDALEALQLQVPTRELAHRLDGLLSIDHIAVPEPWKIDDAYRVVASQAGNRLSDHDAYVVSAVVPDALPGRT
jgi:hypothetical protein